MNILEENEIQIARVALETALRLGAQKARATLNKSLMNLVGTLNGEVDKVSHCLDRSLSLSLFVDGRFGSFSTNRLSTDGLEAFIAKAVDTTRMLAPDQWRTLPSRDRIAKDAQTGLELGLYDSIYDNVTPEQRIATALGASIFKGNDDRRLISEEAEYSDSIYDSIVMDTEGLFCRHTETSFEYGVEMTVEDSEGNKFSGYWWDASTRLAELGQNSCCPKALSRALAQIDPQEVRSGKYNMVVQSEVASKMVTPILNALNAYSVQQNNSFLTDCAGRQAFCEGLTIMDCCRNAGETGSRYFDSEGVATKEHAVIEKGVVKEYFINTYMAGKMGMAPTIEDATRPKVMPWPEAGLDCGRIMEICGDGILVTGFNGGNSNSATGDFSYGIEGFAFHDGKITHPVREMLITGNFLKLWSGLIAAGDDARLCMSKLIPTLAFSNVDFSA